MDVSSATKESLFCVLEARFLFSVSMDGLSNISNSVAQMGVVIISIKKVIPFGWTTPGPLRENMWIFGAITEMIWYARWRVRSMESNFDLIFEYHWYYFSIKVYKNRQ